MDQKVAEIRALYLAATRATIHRDLKKAIEILKSMASEEERERAAVYMDGLSLMRSEWAGQPRAGHTGSRSSRRRR
jgi:cytochrome c-type biogenesis protein CcmH/NrfG